MRRYQELFLEESREHLRTANRILDGEHAGNEPWRDLLRHAHSLKGMAAAMGYRPFVAVAHALEERLQKLRELPPREFDGEIPIVRDGFAQLENLVRDIEHGLLVPDLLAPVHPARDAGSTAESRRPWHIELDLGTLPDGSARRTVSVIAQIATLGRMTQADPPMLDARTGRFEGRLRFVLDSERTREQIHAALDAIDGVPEFSVSPAEAPDPSIPDRSEPTRWVRVTAAQLDALHEGVLELRLEHRRLEAKLAARSRTIRRHLERSQMLLRSVHGTVIELRLVPFESVIHRLDRIVRELAAELDKRVELEIEGAQVRLDRRVLEALVDPLTHVVRNALDHGFESPDERAAAGKPAKGRLRVRLERQGDRVNVSVEDDGRGMQPDRIKKQAVRLGLIEPDDSERLTLRETLMLTTLPGFSTARRVSHVSGRGVGLDIVRVSLMQLGAQLEIRSTPGRGTRIGMSVPLSLAAIRTLLLRCAGATYAVPIEAVRWTTTLSDSDSADPSDELETADGNVPLLRLDRHLGVRDDHADLAEGSWAVVLCSGDRRVALVVDDLAGREDILVRPLRSPLTPLRDYSGAALLADGTVALVLDPARLAAEP
jgi:two-component system chemotaxis sensor kinase CheA